MNDVLGGTFSSRINMNLREDKGWSYGAFSTIVDAEGQRPFLVFAPVQADKTSESLAEIRAELAAVLGDEPATAEEVERVRRERTLTLPGRWETAARVAGDIGAIVRFGLPDDYWAQYPDRVNALDVPAVQSVTESLIDPTEVTWVVVGDRSVVEPGLEALGIADIQVLDADGNPIETE
jgi:zinc protease